MSQITKPFQGWFFIFGRHRLFLAFLIRSIFFLHGESLLVKQTRVKVSVIMPAYNAAAYIDEAIQSVLAQNGVVFELLVGDDASTDDTWKRVTAYRSDPRVRIFRFLKNRGTAATRNRLIAKAKGQYISSCDADDMFLPGNLRLLTKVLDQRPGFGVAYGNWYRVSHTGRRCHYRRKYIFRKGWDLLGLHFANGGTLVRRVLVNKVGGYRTKFKFLEDCDLFLRLSEITRFYHFPGKPLYCRRRTPGSLSRQPKKEYQRVTRQIFNDAVQRRYGYKVKW